MLIKENQVSEVLNDIIEMMQTTNKPFVIGFLKDDGEAVTFLSRNLAPEGVLIILETIRNKVIEDEKNVVTH